MNTSLLTPDGFPRADLDIAQSSWFTFTFLHRDAALLLQSPERMRDRIRNQVADADLMG